MTTIIAKAGIPAPPPDEDFDNDAEPAVADGDRVVLHATSARGERLDRFLAENLPSRLPAGHAGLSRTRIQRWIALGAVQCDGRVLAPAARLGGHERIVVEPQPREADQAFVAEAIPLAVVWRDEALLVIDKPAGLVVHPAAGNWHGTMLNGLLHLDSQLASLPRAGIVHRLDKDTSGLLVVARTEAAMAGLSAQLADRSMGRRYLALVAGRPPQTGTIDAPIGRDDRVRVRMAVVPASRGRAARTHFEVLAVGRIDGRPVSLVECRLETGRTHQIRVHLSDSGWPLIGDNLYGGPSLAGFQRQALHAWRLALRHPVDARRLGWVSPPPPDLRALLEQAGIGNEDLPSAARAGGARADDEVRSDDEVRG